MSGYNNMDTPFGGTFCTTKAGLTGLSGAATTYSTGATAQSYCIHGKAYTKTQISGGAFPATDVLTAAAFVPVPINKGTVLVFTLDAAGNAGVAQGSIESLDTQGNFLNAPQFPVVGEGLCVYAYAHLKNGSTGSTFTPGTSNWNATGMTITTQDVMMLPGRPQTS